MIHLVDQQAYINRGALYYFVDEVRKSCGRLDFVLWIVLIVRWEACKGRVIHSQD